ncbi:helix-turn-helix domain-containing protein [Priestia megaterium]|uniref:helix-turn-helix domain-containing protein n=1 Tax=Priestia megaterium TaxID=1404 RepID=UPI000BF8B503|nr:helix-turn-helix domain-containing protein [Priestia megaterium]NGY70123.1 GAF domain-containing protein [Priestia megaterium]PFT48380.1 transcriptional regulator [Priestia megaterium]
MKESLTHRQLTSLIQISDILNSSLNINLIIDSIMKETVSVIEAADAGVLFLYNSESNLLIAQSTLGYETYRLMDVRLIPGQAMAGAAFLERKSLLFSSQEQVKEAYKTLSNQTVQLFNQSVPLYPYSAVCIPIMSKGECLGIINLGSFQEKVRFTTSDISLLTAISHHAAVAIEKARIFEEKEHIVDNLEVLNAKITQQNQVFSRSIELHNYFANLAIEGEGLSSILDYISKIMGYECLLFNNIGDLILGSSSNKEKEPLLVNITEELSSHLTFENIKNSVKELKIKEINYKTFTLPIGSKQNWLGMLVVCSEHIISEVDIAALEHACTVISLEMMKEQAIYETQQRLKGEFIDVLFSGKMDDSLLKKAKNLKLDQNGNYIVAIIDINGNVLIQKRRYVLQIINRVLRQDNINGLTVTKNNQIIILFSFERKSTLPYSKLKVSQSIDYFMKELSLKRWEINISIGVGRLKAQLENVYKSAQEASKCLRFIERHNLSTNILNYSDLGVHRLLLQNSEEELEDFIYETIGPLLKYDRIKKSNLLNTLSSYLETGRRNAETAKLLHLHINTLNYRLKRIEDILSINFSDTEQFLNLQLALRMYHYLQGKLRVSGKNMTTELEG